MMLQWRGLIWIVNTTTFLWLIYTDKINYAGSAVDKIYINFITFFDNFNKSFNANFYSF